MLFRSPIPSSTFHGRDIFSPTAAHLAKAGPGKLFPKLGPSLPLIHQLVRSKIKKTKNFIEGKILFFDHFGNAITNIHRRDSEETFWRSAHLEAGDVSLSKIQSTYGHGKSLVAVWNSADQLEFALPGGSARLAGSLDVGQPVKVRGK